MKAPRVSATVALAFLLVGCQLFGYGPRVDHTRFTSAKQNDSGIILYTLQEVVYRPAAGMRAFPDGGIPKYVVDRNMIGIIDAGGAWRTLRVSENSKWQNGQGQFFIHSFNGSTAVVTESGQRRDDYLTDIHYYVLDTSTGKIGEVPLKQELASRGRRLGHFYLLDDRGTLLFVTWPSGTRTTEQTTDNEIWLRRPSGDYVLVARGSDLYQRFHGQLVYWEVATRTLFEYDVATGSSRVIPRYTPVPDVRPDSDVRVSTDGTSLERWRSSNGGWRYDGVIVTVDQPRKGTAGRIERQ